MKRKLIAAAVLLTAFAFVPRRGDRTKAAPPMQVPTTADAGRIWLIKRTQPAFDRYTDSPTPALQEWMRDRFFRMIVHSPYFDQRTQWYSGGILYIDAYAVYPRLTGGVNIPQDHPEWILRDVYDNPLYIPWGCDAGTHTCPQYAGDFTNGDYQQWWVDRARNLLGRASYRGLWIDDVNMDFRVGNGDGRMIYPMDRKTGQPMTLQNWRRYMAEFMEKVRRDLPDVEITHNAIWFAGGGNRDEDEFIRRQITAADYIDIEHGVNDGGLSGGDGFFSWRSMLDYIDRVNGLGRHVILDGIAGGDPNDVPALEYAASCYFLVTDGGDFLGDGLNVVSPDNWWPGFDVALDAPSSNRYMWNNVWRRDFKGGFVLVNEPDSRAVAVTLPGLFRRVDGTRVDTLMLNPGRGVILLR